MTGILNRTLPGFAGNKTFCTFWSAVYLSHPYSEQCFRHYSEQLCKKSEIFMENAVYINDDYKATEKLTINYGARLSMFSILGGDTFNTYENGVLTDSKFLEKGKFGKPM